MGWVVVGLGASGRAMALALRRRGERVWGLDDRPECSVHVLQQAGVEVAVGTRGWRLPPPADARLAVSPGVDARHKFVAARAAAGAEVVGDLGLPCPLPFAVVAVTGTNGKSTTSAWIAALLAAQGLRVELGGNFGVPLCTLADAAIDLDAAVVEVSSYQAERLGRFRPHVAVVLNISDDHAARYPRRGDYAAAKARLVQAVPPWGRVVLNADDPEVSAMAAGARAPVWWFSARPNQGAGEGPRDGLVLAAGDHAEPTGALAAWGGMSLAGRREAGRHRRENGLAALLAAQALAPLSSLAGRQQAWTDFRGLDHRLQVVACGAGLTFVDDSKATNDAAAAAAVMSIAQPTWVLAGGADKGGGYRRLRAAAEQRRVRGLVAFGAARAALAAAWAGSPIPCVVVASLEDACRAAVAGARAGDAVLLAPACASFDAYADYRARGRAFAAWARAWLASR